MWETLLHACLAHDTDGTITWPPQLVAGCRPTLIWFAPEAEEQGPYARLGGGRRKQTTAHTCHPQSVQTCPHHPSSTVASCHVESSVPEAPEHQPRKPHRPKKDRGTRTHLSKCIPMGWDGAPLPTQQQRALVNGRHAHTSKAQEGWLGTHDKLVDA
jgi:hypothetical protein